jgi:Tfp pilus assembly protein PilP
MTPAAPIRFQRLILAVLAAAILALAVADWRVLVSTPDSDVVQIVARPATTRSLPLQPQLESPANAPAQPKIYAAILERPLFNSSRRPPAAVTAKPVPPAPKQVQAPFPADKMRLVGILRSPGKPPQALVRVNLNDPGLWIAEGGMVGDWRIEHVGADKVDFSANGATGMLKLAVVQAAVDAPNTGATAPGAASSATPVAAPAPAQPPAPVAAAPVKK